MKQEKVWDKIAPLWDKYKKDGFGSKDGLIHNFIKRRDVVLDLGCGSGRNFISKGRWYGVDFSNEMLKLAKKKKYVNLIKTNIWDTRFKDAVFDKALVISCLHCVNGKANRNKAVKEIYRVLKKNGEAIISVWNKDSKRWRAKDKDKLVSWDIEGDKVERYYYLYGFEELNRDLEKAGFKVLKNSYPLARNIVFKIKK